MRVEVEVGVAALQVRCRRYTFTDHMYQVARGQDRYSMCTLIPVAVGNYVVSDGQLL